MPKQENPAPTTKITISTTPRVAELLDLLVESQLYGKNRAEVAEELLRSKVRDVAKEEGLSGEKLPVPK